MMSFSWGQMVPEPVVHRTFSINGEKGELKNLAKGFHWREGLFWQGKKLLEYKSGLERSGLYSVQTFFSKKFRRKKAFVVIMWNKGAHSQMMEVWAMPEAKKVWEQSTYYAGKASIKEDILHIAYSRDNPKDPKLSKKFYFSD